MIMWINVVILTAAVVLAGAAFFTLMAKNFIRGETKKEKNK